MNLPFLSHELVLEVEKALESVPKRVSSQIPENYFGGGQSKLRYIGVRVPHLRQVMKDGFSFSHLNDSDHAKVWHFIWAHSDCFEVMAMALDWFYQPKQRHLLVQHWKLLKRWSSKIDNWAHSDTLSGIFARILEDDPAVIFPTLVQWNSAKNPWLRRLSIVSLIHYSSLRRQVLPLKKILNLVEPQLEYEHYYVQKGVGWTLREAYNLYPQKTFLFIKKNIHRVSSTAFSAATEKMPPEQKAVLKTLRKGVTRK